MRLGQRTVRFRKGRTKFSYGILHHFTSDTETDAAMRRSDFSYMAPPFLAYYGALQNDYSLLKEAYNQLWLYRYYLRDENTGLWRHVALGDWQDNNLWATGNGWAAAGIMRVLKTINSSSLADTLVGEQADLASWVDEILSGAWAHQVRS